LARGKKSKLPITKADVENFRNRCIYARALLAHHQYLFSSNPDHSRDLKNISRFFFGDVHHAFRDQLIIHICALIEQRTKSLTVNFFLNNADWDGFDVTTTKRRLEEFYKIMKPARDNLLAHYNRDTLFRAERLGAADIDLWNQFWSDIQQIVNILSKKYLNQEGVYINGIALTDLPALVASLQQDTGSP